MRIARVLSLVLLFVPAGLRSQDHGSQFRDAISWGADKQTFPVTLTIRNIPGTFMVSEQGFRWFLSGSADTGTSPIPWGDISAWSCQSPARLEIKTQNGGAEVGLNREDLLNVVNRYLRKYASAALDAAEGCSPEQF